METLFERLKDEQKAILLAEAEKYPTSVGRVIEQMKSVNTYFQLTFDIVTDFAIFVGLSPFDLNTFYSYFKDFKNEN